jgi:hypothetical protein
MCKMILVRCPRRPPAALGLIGTLAMAAAAPASAATPAPDASTAPAADPSPVPARCLESGDGYLHAQLAGAIEARVDWANAGTRCAGEPKSTPPGVRLSFTRSPSDATDLLFVFGLTGVREGRAAREVGANLTVILQGRIFGTLGDSRCTVDTLTQRRVGHSKLYRVEARGFCTQPAHAVRGDGAVLVSTFEFAGPVNYDTANDGAAPIPAVAK